MVNVPVLSEQITEVQPNVSTDGNERTIAFFFAIRRVPNAKQVVMTAGKPSGMAATAESINKNWFSFDNDVIDFWRKKTNPKQRQS